MEVIEVLRKARAKIAGGPGLWKEHGQENGNHCIITAINTTVSNESEYRAAELLISAKIGVKRSLFGFTGGIIAYNDAPWRRQDHVLALFDSVIADLEPKRVHAAHDRPNIRVAGRHAGMGLHV